MSKEYYNVRVKVKEEIIMNELMKIENKSGEQLVSGRELWKFLESKQEFSNWIKNRIVKYDFIEDEDFTVDKFINGKATQKEYILKLDMAKELAMVEGNDKGKQARRYFIACEKKLKQTVQPSYQVADPIERAKIWIEEEEKRVQLENQIKIDKPRVEFAKTIEGSSEKILIGDLAKLTDGKIGRNKLFKLLREKKVLMNSNLPYQQYLDRGYFEVTERIVKSVTRDILTTTTFCTGKGQIWILSKINEWM